MTLVPTKAAARAVGATATQLEQWADAELLTPAGIDDHGRRLWDVDDLREQYATVRATLEEP